MPIPQISTLNLAQAKHLLRRATFGANRAKIQSFVGLGIATAINNLTNSPNFTMPPDPINENGVNWTMTKPQPEEEDFKNEENIKAWWLSRMYEDDTALEKLTFFLHTIITTKRGVVGSSRFLYHQSKMFRQYLVNEFTNSGNPNFRNYKDFIREMILENSMLIFLDGRINEKGLPNENFARELFELFTLGKGETIGVGNYTNYTEDDIKEAARVLTGWTTDDYFSTNQAVTTPNLSAATGLPTGKAKTNTLAGGVEFAYAHDNGTKTVLGRTITSPTTPTPLSAYQEIVDLVEAIFAKRDAQGVLVACRYFVRRLYRFFVHHYGENQLPASVENTIIIPLAQDMESNGFRIAPIVRNLLSSQHFYDMGALSDTSYADGAMVKSPLELVIGTLKYFDTGSLLSALPKPSGISAGNAMDFYMKWGSINRQVLLTGLDFLEPYDVAGYEPYHQAPNYARNWITTNTLANRYNFIRNLFNSSNGWGFWVDVYAWAKQFSEIDALATQSEVIAGIRVAKNFAKAIVAEFLTLFRENDELTDKRINYFAFYHIRDIAGVNPNDPDARYNAWVLGWTTSNPAIAESNARGPLRALLSAIMQSPEYQLF